MHYKTDRMWFQNGVRIYIFKKLIDKNRHLIIKSSHPSGLSAHKGFFTSKPFSKTNDYLKDHLVGEIDWKIN